jgi:hypothetical protein
MHLRRSRIERQYVINGKLLLNSDRCQLQLQSKTKQITVEVEDGRSRLSVVKS